MEHTFSVEMKSKKFLKIISISDDPRNRVYFEGFLGEIEEISFIDGGMLEIQGINGIFRMDISKKELRKMLAKEVV